MYQRYDDKRIYREEKSIFLLAEWYDEVIGHIWTTFDGYTILTKKMGDCPCESDATVHKTCRTVMIGRVCALKIF